MDRNAWLKDMRRQAEEKYNRLWAPEYGEKYGRYPNSTHIKFIQKFLRLVPRGSALLDAACGAGRYFDTLTEAGYTVVGIDQSAGMLERARSLHPGITVEKMGLQELSYSEAFEGAVCIDAMENVFPEDWPLVLGNLQRALKGRGFLYFTVEIADEPHVMKAYLEARKAGLPVIMGEWPGEESYHYYPSMQLVRGWIRQAGFSLMEEGEGDEYQHFIVRKMAFNGLGSGQTDRNE
jgi:SAM-dependent methyltransferase